MGHFSLLWRKHLHWIHTENLKQHTIIVNEECILQHYDTSKNTSTPKRLVQVWHLRNDSYFLVCSSSQEGITFPSTSTSIPQLQRGVLFLMEVERLWSGSTGLTPLVFGPISPKFVTYKQHEIISLCSFWCATQAWARESPANVCAVACGRWCYHHRTIIHSLTSVFKNSAVFSLVQIPGLHLWLTLSAC